MMVSLFLSMTKQGRQGLNYLHNRISSKSISIEFDKKSLGINYGYLLTALPFVFVSCFRYDVGTDYMGYVMSSESRIFDDGYTSELIYTAVTYISIYIFDNPYLIIVFFGLLYNVLIYRFIYENTTNIYLSIIFFLISGCFNFSLNIMRQMLAVAIFFVSVKYIINKDYKRYYINILIAILIHKTAFLFIPLFFINKISLNKKMVLGLPVIAYMCAELARNAVMFLSFMFGLYQGYFYNIYDMLKPSYAILAMCIISFVLGVHYKFTNKCDTKINILFNLQFICLILAEWIGNIPNGARLAYMLIPIQCVMLPNAIMNIKNKKYRVLVGSCVIGLLSAIYIHYFYIQNMGMTFPYKFVFFE